MIPNSRPKITEADALKHIAHIDRSKYPLVILGIRGYYQDTMGKPGVNDIGLYDDAIILHHMAGAYSAFATFNGNTDPSRQRDGMATLKPGTYFSHCIGMHKGSYTALIQRMGKVTVLRYRTGKNPIEDTGYFGINIHRGGDYGTSSEGCQTVPRINGQYDEFIDRCIECMQNSFKFEYHNQTIPYVLVDVTQ